MVSAAEVRTCVSSTLAGRPLSNTSDIMRRRWKLAALKAFAAFEPVSTLVISKNIGQAALEELLNQCFSLHPHDPTLGAKNLHDSLFERFGERFKEPIPRKPYVRRNPPGTRPLN